MKNARSISINEFLSVYNFYPAFVHVYKKGGCYGKPDITMKQGKEFVKKLITSIKNYTYSPDKLRKFKLQKENGGYRKLTILSFKDSIVSHAIKQIIVSVSVLCQMYLLSVSKYVWCP